MPLKKCKTHGLTEGRYESKANGSKAIRCIKCASSAVQKRRSKLKTLAIEYKGGCCSLCGYNKSVAALEFHHLDPNEKDFAISAGGLTRAFDKIKIELDKCQLLCANCHREVHAEEVKERAG